MDHPQPQCFKNSKNKLKYIHVVNAKSARRVTCHEKLKFSGPVTKHLLRSVIEVLVGSLGTLGSTSPLVLY